MPLSVGDKLGPFQILSPIGAGGMGEVYKARDTRLDRAVAIKVSKEKFSERFEREARFIAALNHPNICQPYDVGPNYLVMELVEGPTLAERMKQGVIEFDDTVWIARQIADALEAAHEKAITHRDLKPGNVKIKRDGTVKVLDFGLAKIGGARAAQTSDSPTVTMDETEAGVIIGTAAYLAPEQAKGKPVDKRADIWAFGAVVYEMLAGRRLFEGETTTEILAAVIKEEPDWNCVPAKAWLMLRRCLEKDPKKRLHDIADAILLLEDASEPAPVPRSQGTWIAWGVAAALLVIAVALSFLYFRRESPPHQASRFQIPVPEKLLVSAFNISPDGRRLAFIGRRAEDPIGRLYVRALDSLAARPLPGTEGANYPIWSPDARFIAFNAEGKLMKIDASGGPPETICDVSGRSEGGSWNRDNVIIFGSNQGVMQVSAEGGTPSAVTLIDAARGEQDHFFPSFLPDGRHFVYARIAAAQENSGVYIGSIDFKPQDQIRKRRSTTPTAPIYAASTDGHGRLLFARDGTLLAQTLDTGRLELTGEPLVVAEQVGSFGNRGGTYGQFSASTNGVLIYKTVATQNSQLTWYDRTGKVLGTPGEPGAYSFVRLSPNAARAAVNQAGDLWVMDLVSGRKTRLTSDGSIGYATIWSPDEGHIAYSASRGGIYQRASDGSGGEELLLKTDGPVATTSWSTDGRFILYQPPSGRAVLALRKDDHKPFQLLKGEFIFLGPAFSPDGRWIAYRSNESGRNEIYVQPFNPDATGGPSVTGAKQIVSKGGSLGMNNWRADGKELYYLDLDGKVTAAEIATNPAFRVGEPKALFQVPPDFVGAPGTAPSARAAASGDGKRFLFAMPVPQNWCRRFQRRAELDRCVVEMSVLAGAFVSVTFTINN